MQKDLAQVKISLKVVGGLLFLTHPVYLLLMLLPLPRRFCNHCVFADSLKRTLDTRAK